MFQSLGFRIQGLGFQGLGFRVLMVRTCGFKIENSIRIQGFEV